MISNQWIPSISRHFNPGTPSEVILVGIESHICVTQTTLDLLAAGHKVISSSPLHSLPPISLTKKTQVYILADGISSCNPQEIPIALSRLRAAGAIITTSESIIYEIMGDARYVSRFILVNRYLKT